MAAAAPPIRLRPRPVPSGTTFERLGADACGDDELLRLVLGSPHVMPQARRILDELSGLPGLSRATPRELMALGLTRRAALRLAASIAVGRRIAGAWPADEWRVRSPSDVGERLLESMGPLEREELRVLLLDTKNTITAQRTVYRGNLAGSSVRVGEVFRDAVRDCAAAIVVVHNHPSGDPAPSGDDLRITAELAHAGRLLDIELLDHLVIGRGRWVSLRQIGAVGSFGRNDAVDRAAARIGDEELAVGRFSEAGDAHAGLEQDADGARRVR